MSATTTDDWLDVLRRAVAASTASAVSERLGLSATTVSLVLAGKYTAGTERIAERVRGVYLGHVVTCPVMGEVARQICLDAQAAPFAATNPQRVRLHRACRGGCPHALTTGGQR